MKNKVKKATNKSSSRKVRVRNRQTRKQRAKTVSAVRLTTIMDKKSRGEKLSGREYAALRETEEGFRAIPAERLAAWASKLRDLIEMDWLGEGETRMGEYFGIPSAFNSQSAAEPRYGFIGFLMLATHEGEESKVNRVILGQYMVDAIRRGDHKFFRRVGEMLKRLGAPRIETTVTRLLNLKRKLYSELKRPPTQQELEVRARESNIPVSRYDRIWKRPGLRDLKDVPLSTRGKRSKGNV